MADAEKDFLGPGEDLVPLADGGGPFQCFDDVPGKRPRSSRGDTTEPDFYKGYHAVGEDGDIGGPVVAAKDNLAGR